MPSLLAHNTVSCTRSHYHFILSASQLPSTSISFTCQDFNENLILWSSYTYSFQSLIPSLYFHSSFFHLLAFFSTHPLSCLITLLLLSFCLSPTLLFLPYQCLLHLPYCLTLSLILFFFLSFPCTLPYQTHLTLLLPLTVLISPLPSPLSLYHCLLLTPHIIRLLCPYLLHISLIPLSLPFHSSANLEEGFRTTRPSTRLIQHYYISQAISLSLYTSSIHATHS